MKTIVDVQSYISPVCKVILVGTHQVFCGSETEKVNETDGEW